MDAEVRKLLKVIKKSEKLLNELKTMKKLGEEVEILEELKLSLEKKLLNKVGKRIEPKIWEEVS